MGRTPSTEITPTVEKFGVKYIRPYHRELARRIVLGASEKELCNEFHVHPTTMSIITQSPLFKLELLRLEQMRDQGVADVTKTLRDLSPIALDVMERTMYRTASERLKVDIAESILDRAGFGAINKVIADVTSRSVQGYDDLTPDEKRRLLAERIEKMKQEALEKEEEVKETEAVEVKFECVDPSKGDACSKVEQSFGGFADCD